MANHKSAKKRIRSNLRRNQVNKRVKTSVKTCEKKLRNLINDGKKEEAQKTLNVLFCLLDRSRKTGTCHANKSSRKKSRYSSQIHRLS